VARSKTGAERKRDPGGAVAREDEKARKREREKRDSFQVQRDVRAGQTRWLQRTEQGRHADTPTSLVLVLVLVLVLAVVVAAAAVIVVFVVLDIVRSRTTVAPV